VLAHTQASSGGFLASGCNDGASPPPPRVIHCRTGNLLRALLGFGWYNEYAYNGKTWVDFDPSGVAEQMGHLTCMSCAESGVWIGASS